MSGRGSVSPIRDTRTSGAAEPHSNARRDTKAVMANTLLGIIAEMQNRPVDARSRYERALQLEPKAATAANNLAWLYAESGENLDVALQLAQTAKAGLPDTPEVNDTL